MSKLLWKSLLVSPAILGTALAISTTAIAAETQPVESIQQQVSEIPDTLEPVAALEPVAGTTVALAAPEATVEPGFAVETEVPEAIVATEAPAQIALTPVEQATSAPVVSSPISVAQVSQYSNEGTANVSVGQVTSVSQLSDVQPTDWAFQALQSLVERYGCIVGYPDGTYRGNRALTRYEFAAGLNACMDRVNELIAAGIADLVTREDLATLQRLQEEFAAELATLRGRVDALEARTAELEANQFSTTTKLVGEAIFAVTDQFGGGDNNPNNTVLQDRVRLDLQTSFTGRDVLHTRLAAGNATPFNNPNGLGGFSTGGVIADPANIINNPPGTAEGTQQFNIGGNTNNSFGLDWLSYYFPVGQNLQLYVAATGGIHSDYVYSTVNPYFEDFDGGNGALSAFGQSSPIYRIGGGAGAGVNFRLGRALAVSLGYLGGPDANDPSPRNGLFNGNYAALGQVTFTPSENLQVGLTYVHGYHRPETPIFNLGGSNQFFTGTNFANVAQTALGTPAVTNSYGAQASLRLGTRLALNGFFGYTDANYLNTGKGEIWYYGAGLALPDFGKEGNLLGLMVGVEPYLGGTRGALIPEVPVNDTSLHVEGFYRYRLTDNISITPGVIWITAPNQNNNNNDVVIGTLRTTFTF